MRTLKAIIPGFIVLSHGKWWSFTGEIEDFRWSFPRTVACHHSWTIEDEDPHLDTTWLVVPWNASNKCSCAQRVYEKNTNLGKNLFHKLSPGSTINFFTKNQSLLCDFSVHWIYAYSLKLLQISPIQKNNNLPSFQTPQPLLATPVFYRCFALRCIDAVDQRNALTSGHWGHNSREGLLPWVSVLAVRGGCYGLQKSPGSPFLTTWQSGGSKEKGIEAKLECIGSYFGSLSYIQYGEGFLFFCHLIIEILLLRGYNHKIQNGEKISSRVFYVTICYNDKRIGLSFIIGPIWIDTCMTQSHPRGCLKGWTDT